VIGAERRQDLIAVLILAVATLIFFWDAAWLNGAFFVQDVMVQNYPFRHFCAQSLKDFSLPLWHPAINCGFPLHAEGQVGLFYPFNFLSYLLLSAYAGINLNIVFHIWWAGVGTYGLLRTLGTRPVAALAGAMTYGFSGFLVIRAMSPNYIDACAWMPFLLWFIERAAQTRQGRWIWWTSGIMGLQFLAGHPQATVYAIGIAVLYGIYRAWIGGLGWRFIACVALGAPLLAGGLAAVQLVPTAELVRLSTRSAGVGLEQFVNMSLPPERLATLLLPNFFGNSGTGSYWGGDAGFFIQLCAYMGIVPLLLAYTALLRRRDHATFFFGALTLVALLLSLGRYTAVFEVLYQIPGLHFFRFPSRFLLWWALGLAVLCGLGLDHWLRQGRGAKSVWGVCLVLALAGASMAWLNRPVLSAEAGQMQPLSVTHGAGLERYKEDLQGDLWRCFMFLGLGGTLLAIGRGRGSIAWGVPVLIFADLFHFGQGFNALIPPQVYQETPASAAFIQMQAAQRSAPLGLAPRILSLVSERNSPYDWHGGWVHDPSSYLAYPQTLRLYTGSLYGVANVLPGWSPLHLQRHWEFSKGYPGFARLAGAEYLVSYQPLANKVPAFNGEIKVYPLEKTLPRAYLVGRYEIFGETRQRLQALQRRDFDSEHNVALEKIPAFEATPKQSSGQVQIVSYAADQVELNLADHQGGILVLSDTYYPGWKALVDGIEGEILRANHVFRAVAVEPGARQVVFRYVPSSLYQGCAVSLIALFLLSGLLIYHKKATRGLVREPLPVTASMHVFKWAGLASLILIIHAWVRRPDLWLEALERARVLSVWGGS